MDLPAVFLTLCAVLVTQIHSQPQFNNQTQWSMQRDGMAGQNRFGGQNQMSNQRNQWGRTQTSNQRNGWGQNLFGGQGNGGVQARRRGWGQTQRTGQRGGWGQNQWGGQRGASQNQVNPQRNQVNPQRNTAQQNSQRAASQNSVQANQRSPAQTQTQRATQVRSPPRQQQQQGYCSRFESNAMFRGCAWSWGRYHLTQFRTLAREGKCRAEVFNCTRTDQLVGCINNMPIRRVSNRCWLMVRDVLSSFLKRYDVPCVFQDVYEQCRNVSQDIKPMDQRNNQGGGGGMGGWGGGMGGWGGGGGGGGGGWLSSLFG